MAHSFSSPLLVLLYTQPFSHYNIHNTIFSNELFKGFKLSSLFLFLCLFFFQLLYVRHPALSLLTVATVQLHINNYYEFFRSKKPHSLTSYSCTCTWVQLFFVTDCIEIRNMCLCPVVISSSSPSKQQKKRNPKDYWC